MKSYIGENIKRFRCLRNLTQENLSDKVGLTVNYIYMLEHGRRNPSIRVLRKISEILGVSMPLLTHNFNEPKNEVEKVLKDAYEIITKDSKGN